MRAHRRSGKYLTHSAQHWQHWTVIYLTALVEDLGRHQFRPAEEPARREEAARSVDQPRTAPARLVAIQGSFAALASLTIYLPFVLCASYLINDQSGAIEGVATTKSCRYSALRQVLKSAH